MNSITVSIHLDLYADLKPSDRVRLKQHMTNALKAFSDETNESGDHVDFASDLITIETKDN